MTLVWGGFALPNQVESSEGWAASELGHAHLGDRRLTARLVALATAVADHPEQSLPCACGDWAATKGAYRFFSNESVDPADILAAHRQSTVDRIGMYRTVLAVQDSTFCYFTTHAATRGLGPLRQKGSLGFCAHSCLALTPDGVPLGLLGQKVWTRPDPASAPKRDGRGKRAADGKESTRWLEMLEESTRNLPTDTRVPTVRVTSSNSSLRLPVFLRMSWCALHTTESFSTKRATCGMQCNELTLLATWTFTCLALTGNPGGQHNWNYAVPRSR